MKTLQEALANPETITELKITEKDILDGLPKDLLKLTNLKKLFVTGNETA